MFRVSFLGPFTRHEVVVDGWSVPLLGAQPCGEHDESVMLRAGTRAVIFLGEWYPLGMPNRSSKRSRDINELAAQIVNDATNEAEPVDPYEGKDQPQSSLAGAGGSREVGHAPQASLPRKGLNSRGERRISAGIPTSHEHSRLPKFRRARL